MIPKVHKYYNLGIRILIGIIAYCFLFRKLLLQHDLHQIVLSLNELMAPAKIVTAALLLIVLMLLNWTIEAVKWRMLINQVEKITYADAMIAVFAGITVSFFTPNRVGEFLGRVFVLNTADRIKSSVLTIVGSLTQLVITLTVGSLALLLFLNRYTSLFLSLNPIISAGVVSAWLFFVVLLIVGLYYLRLFAGSEKKDLHENWRNKLLKSLNILQSIPASLLTKIIFLSLCRYIVFTFQACLLLRWMGISISLSDSIILVSVVFLILTAIPTMAIAELGVRGSVATFLFGFYERNQTGYMTGTWDVQVIVTFSLLWIINIGIPALIGSFTLGKLHFFRDSRP